ncbi:hypothetical protein HPC49_00605 [Pyxidicoccus fallax]|uniref:DUF3592 domain-containing protein n=1 Tax=Pyxidicoccus fallax TaxID=394095 RepID=A0A848L4Z2_9BACT|nr:hypothetical protein [Pyxidicoccus fallax]NMO13537.1 hypothetical protein [Pyxidicoccus fallax]NPC76755.1 hypothetical protein [Pyxidicoccus fallax]
MSSLPLSDPPPETNRATFADVLPDDLERARALLASVPRAPRVPSKEARRLVLAFAGPQRYALYTSLFFLLGIGLFCAFFQSHRAVGDLLLDHHSVEVPGVVDSVEVGMRRRRSLSPVYCARFHSEDGTLVGRSCEPGGSFQPGQRVVLERRGGLARIRGTTLIPMGRWGGIALLFPLVGAVGLLLVVRTNHRESRAARVGIPILARVTYFGDGKPVNKKAPPPTELRWSFIARGERYEGRLSLDSASEFDFLPSRDVIVVLYDPAAPGINTVYVP